MRFAIHTLVFYGLDTLEPMLRNTGPFVEKIYLSYSPLPWDSYNCSARKNYQVKIDERFIKNLPYQEKIIWLEGIWSSEDEQRNHSLERARQDGIDYLIVQDLDEFYLPTDFLANLEAIRNNPDYAVYRCPWTVFWKSLNYVIQVREHNGVKGATITACPNFAVNVKFPGIRFSNRRLTNRMDKVFMLPGLCLHLAWVLSDDEVKQKIETWGHSHQFNHKKWYRHKWLAWSPKTKYIGHITRANYTQAVPYSGELPKELITFPVKDQITKPLDILEKVDCFLRDYSSVVRIWISNFSISFKKLLQRRFFF